MTQYPTLPVLWRFFAMLESNGIDTTPWDKMQVMQGLQEIDLSERDQVRATLRANTVRDPEKLSIFERLFQIYFSDANWQKELIENNSGDAADQKKQLAEDVPPELQKIAQDNPALQALLDSDFASLQMQLQQAANAVGLERIQSFMQLGYFNYQMLDQMNFFAMQGQMRGMGGGGSGQQTLERLRSIVHEYVQRALQAQDIEAKENFRKRQLEDQSFLTVTPDQRQNIKDEILRLAEILKTKATRRRKKQKRGHLHVHRTIRHNLMHDGVPFVRQYRDKFIRKPEIVLLLDMSESVRNASEFMLLFVYSVQEVFTKVRSYIFAGQMAETTDLFKESTFDEAVETIFTGEMLNIWASSNFGRSFEDFSHNWMDAVTNKTTVIILGDARNNYNATRADIVGEMRHRAKAVYWLNPEARSSWGFGDSAMEEYADQVDHAVEVRNIRQLSDFIHHLVLKSGYNTH